MARVSEASRTGPEGGRSAPSPLGREGAEGGLSKLIRSAGIAEGVSVPLVSSSSKSAFLGPMFGVSMSYVSESEVRKSFGGRASRRAGAGMEVMGKGVGTSATRGADPTASWTLGAVWRCDEERAAASLAVGLLSPSFRLPGLRSLTSEAAGFDWGSGLEGTVFVRGGAFCAGGSVSTVFGFMGSLFIGGRGAGFFGSKDGEEEAEDVASGDTGGLPLAAFRAASFGECLRFGGIGVSDFRALVPSGVLGGGVTFLSCSSAVLLLLRSTNGAILASTAEVEMSGAGGPVFDSGVGAGARTGVGEGSEGSLAGVDRLQVRVVVSLEGLS